MTIKIYNPTTINAKGFMQIRGAENAPDIEVHGGRNENVQQVYDISTTSQELAIKELMGKLPSDTLEEDVKELFQNIQAGDQTHEGQVESAKKSRIWSIVESFGPDFLAFVLKTAEKYFQ